MSWITNEWRLKLGAVALSLVLLGAVAFSQPTNKVTVQINYINRPSNLVLVTYPRTIDVGVAGPAEALSNSPNTITATADLSHLKKGTNQQITLKVKSSDPRITPVGPPPINLDADDLVTVQLPVQIRPTSVAPGWQVTAATALCGNSTDACSVTFTGPATLADGLTAYAVFTSTIAADSNDTVGQVVAFERKGKPFDLSKIDTLPAPTIDPPAVNVHIDAKTGTETRQVVLIDAPPTRLPPPGYRVTKIVINPTVVLITGLSDVIASAGDTITLGAVDLGNATSDVTFRVNIPYPDGTSGTVKTATITYSISQNPNVSPSPSP